MRSCVNWERGVYFHVADTFSKCLSLITLKQSSPACTWLCRYLSRGTSPSSTPLFIRWHLSHTRPLLSISQECNLKCERQIKTGQSFKDGHQWVGCVSSIEFCHQARSQGRSCGGSSLSWHIIPVLLVSIIVNIPTFFSSKVSLLLRLCFGNIVLPVIYLKSFN